jgi:hypothetical protein
MLRLIPLALTMAAIASQSANASDWPRTIRPVSADERELQGAHRLLPRLRDHQDMSRIRVDRAERYLVGGQILGRIHAIPGGTELISGEQGHDGGDIAGFRPAQNHRGAA